MLTYQMVLEGINTFQHESKYRRQRRLRQLQAIRPHEAYSADPSMEDCLKAALQLQ